MTTEGGSQGAAGAAPAQGQAVAAGVTLGTPTEGAGGTGAGSQSGSGQGAGAGSASDKPWFDGLVKDADNLKTIEAKQWKSPEDAIKSYRELEVRLSKGAQSQAPADPKEYAFNVPKEMEQSYSNELAEAFRQTAHKAGLSKEQAAAVHDAFIGFQGQSLKAATEAMTKQVEKDIQTTKSELEQAWGNTDTPEFKRNLEMAKRAMSRLDPNLEGALRDAGVIAKDGTLTNAAIFKALAKAGSTMFAEDTLFGTDNANVNPFAKATENLQLQSRLVKEQPERAKLLIRTLPPAEQEKWSFFLNG